MAKLTDGRNWLERTLGDEGRAHSLIVKGRDQGLFTKGKRGGNAPDLILADFAALVFCALSSAAPSKIKESVEEIMSLGLVGIEIDANDVAGWRGPFYPNNLPDDVNDVLEGFSLGMRGMQRPDGAALAWALIMLFVAHSPEHDFNSFDKIELIEQGDFLSAEITLHEKAAGVSADGYRREGPGHNAIRLTFGNDCQHIDPTRMEIRRTLYGPALNGVAEMTKFMRATK
ncbi:hypothetical protein DL1_07900 [Thioclava dalianensis]|uniref:Uncharacterized protein n=2 Tax=Thioclava dalianensis TaxID=1185766 RepID=A0A074TIV3_9RHOB|nr:hypothetical protein [Thioclava dalianensis]KEP68943.1 hypothetical protein DL1_07900 [Thioclava dalianensis]